MAVPKGKVSRARKGSRSSANFKAPKVTLVGCPQCHEPVRPHTICGACGFYKGVKRIEGTMDKKEAKARAAAAAQ